jgi:isopentenyl-diphosphate delta-isomerase
VSTPPRKLDHIRIAVDSPVEHPRGTGLEEVELLHNAVPEESLDHVDTSVVFLGRRLSAPLMVTAMTGGHEVAAKINCAIAEAVAELGLAMGVGSQRAAIEHPELARTFRSARDCGGDIVLVANIGAPQLVKGYGVEEALRAVEMIDADALAVHLNAAQEAFQPEGDTDYRGVLKALERLAAELPVPVIVKETGHGIGLEAARALRAAGIRFLDVSGAGGTSWVRVEMYRAAAKGDHVLASVADIYAGWGIPTAQAVVEARWGAPDACIIASGGVRTGLDAAKAVALGADLAGTALPVIKAYAEGGSEAIKQLLAAMVKEIRAAVFLTGAGSLRGLRRTPLLLSPGLLHRLRSRGVRPEIYLEAGRSLFYPGQHC